MSNDKDRHTAPLFVDRIYDAIIANAVPIVAGQLAPQALDIWSSVWFNAYSLKTAIETALQGG